MLFFLDRSKIYQPENVVHGNKVVNKKCEEEVRQMSCFQVFFVHVMMFTCHKNNKTKKKCG